MDEAEKYKQRLEAIAEKRRLQEEQDKARREVEDEKLRQQQLKRKSLRDQWLMEGAPLSPTSPNTKNLLSSLWDSQDTEKPSDKLQAENQWLSEELQEQKAVETIDPAAEMVPGLLQNGENKATEPETPGDEVALIQTPPQVETAAVLPNGGGDVDPNTSEQSKLNPNGLDRVTEGVDRTESASVPNINEEEVEEGILVMRAEPVFITDDGDDGPEEDQQESDQTLPSHPEKGNEMGEDTEQEVLMEPAPESLTEPENNEATQDIVELTGGEDEEEESGVKLNKIIEGETKAEDQHEEVEDMVCGQLQAPAGALEGATVALFPAHYEASPSDLSPKPEAQINDEASAAPMEEEEALKVEDPVCQSGSFQEVSLADPQENQRTKVEPGEQEPLLVKAKASYVNADSAGSNGPIHADTQNPPKTSQGEETGSPKRKTCQCCAVM
uniref:Paralemmin 3 n=1 Tax=Iconisemion striatum TaxID=60296 RepID=A0A1A7Y8F4_9TELE